jgi:hypothetical protein
MIQHVYRHLGVGVAFPSEVADQLLLLGVDTDDRVARRQIIGLDLGDVLKLRVPIGMGTQGVLLRPSLLEPPEAQTSQGSSGHRKEPFLRHRETFKA